VLGRDHEGIPSPHSGVKRRGVAAMTVNPLVADFLRARPQPFVECVLSVAEVCDTSAPVPVLREQSESRSFDGAPGAPEPGPSPDRSR